ncbi:uncharacterized protein LOC112153747 isoform X2 [Oryzias melastigma]|nr:uncharacterized protein LOC112153747 isoform X2 [Oryzias melastigma]
MEVSSQCWPPSGAGPAASRGWLRRFLLLKLITVLLFPHSAGLPLLVGCVFSLGALSLLRSPHISTKPSTVILAQLALTDGLVLLQWVLQVGVTLSSVMERKMSRPVGGLAVVRSLCQQLLESHYLASLLLLGLLGLEAALVSRWPQQTRRFRTSLWAQFSCRMVWTLVLLEFTLLLHSRLLEIFRQQVFPPTLPGASLFLRWMLWMLNSWLLHVVFNNELQKRSLSQ